MDKLALLVTKSLRSPFRYEELRREISNAFMRRIASSDNSVELRIQELRTSASELGRIIKDESLVSFILGSDPQSTPFTDRAKGEGASREPEKLLSYLMEIVEKMRRWQGHEA